MSKYFSATTCSFYDTAIITETKIPKDKVAVTEERYNELMTLQAQGYVIYAAADGTPATKKQSCSPCYCLKHETTKAGTETLGHVNLAKSLDDPGAASVPTAAQVKAGLNDLGETVGLNAEAIEENEEAIEAETKRAQAAEKANADAIAALYNYTKDSLGDHEQRLDALVEEDQTIANAIAAETQRAQAAEKTNETNISKKANDSDVVHNKGAEEIAGKKTFLSAPVFTLGNGFIVKGTTKDFTVRSTGSTSDGFFVIVDNDPAKSAFSATPDGVVQLGSATFNTVKTGYDVPASSNSREVASTAFVNTKVVTKIGFPDYSSVKSLAWTLESEKAETSSGLTYNTQTYKVSVPQDCMGLVFFGLFYSTVRITVNGNLVFADSYFNSGSGLVIRNNNVHLYLRKGDIVRKEVQTKEGSMSASNEDFRYYNLV